MEGRVVLSDTERKRCLRMWRRGPGVSVARRALVLLKLNEGASYRTIQKSCLVSSDFIVRVKRC